MRWRKIIYFFLLFKIIFGFILFLDFGVIYYRLDNMLICNLILKIFVIMIDFFVIFRRLWIRVWRVVIIIIFWSLCAYLFFWREIVLRSFWGFGIFFVWSVIFSWRLFFWNFFRYFFFVRGFIFLLLDWDLGWGEYDDGRVLIFYS